jgi:hypothetical protein
MAFAPSKNNHMSVFGWDIDEMTFFLHGTRKNISSSARSFFNLLFFPPAGHSIRFMERVE